MVRDPIVYVEVGEKEKVFKALAVALESGFASALKSQIQKTPFSACVRIEKTNLQAVLKSSPKAACALQVRYESGLTGNALIVCHTSDLVILYELLAGAEAVIGESLSPELTGVCTRFFAVALSESNKLFSERHAPVSSGSPEMVNPDGTATKLTPLSSSYEGVLSATYDVSVEPKLDARFHFLIDAQVLDSLIQLLPQYDPNPHVQSAAEQRLAARKQKPEEQPFTYVASEVDSSPLGLPKSGQSKSSGNWNIDLLLDVELPIAVSFGECEMPLRDVLKLAAGSVIELDKSVNDPVTVIVNEKPIARGEVVMVDGNYGVRITEVESTANRIRSLG